MLIIKDFLVTRETKEPIYATLSDEQVRDIDQFILRFSKLQDTMGNRLFPATLYYLAEQIEDRPMIDKLNRLEKLGFIENAERWRMIRNIRNKFAHDYPDDPDKNAAQLNLAFASAMDLYAMLAMPLPTSLPWSVGHWTTCGVPCEIYALHNRKGRLQMCKAMAGKWCRQMLREIGAVA